MGWKKGTVIFEANPYVHVIMQQYREERCNFCLKRSDDLRKCAACKKVWFCGRTCQKKDWKLHKMECPVMKRVPDTPTDSMCLFLRLVIQHLLGRSSVRQEKEENPCIRSFNDLMSHTDNIKKDYKNRLPLFEVACDFLRAYTCGLLTLPSGTELMNIFGKMVTNTFTIADETLQDVACGIYNSPSILDHSCEANAAATFNGRTVTVKAIADIDSSSYEEVFLSYLDPLNLTSERQKQLQKTYYFLCNCRRCTSNDIEKMMCSIEGSSEGDLLKVKSCLTMMKVMEKNQGSPENLLSVCEQCLCETSLPDTNVHKIKLICRGIESAIEAKDFEKAAKLGCQNIEPYSLMYPSNFPCVGHVHANLGKLLLYVRKLKEGHTHLVKSLKIFTVSLRNDHPLLQQVKELLVVCEAEMNLG